MSTTPTRRNPIPACPDCRAPAGAPCDTDCPALVADVRDWTLAELDSWEAGDVA